MIITIIPQSEITITTIAHTSYLSLLVHQYITPKSAYMYMQQNSPNWSKWAKIGQHFAFCMLKSTPAWKGYKEYKYEHRHYWKHSAITYMKSYSSIIKTKRIHRHYHFHASQPKRVCKCYTIKIKTLFLALLLPLPPPLSTSTSSFSPSSLKTTCTHPPGYNHYHQFRHHQHHLINYLPSK